MKAVYQFIDYRKFLEHYYQEQKRLKRAFSHRYFAAKAGLSSPSFLKAVMDGKRNLTSRTIERFCAAIGFSFKEARYFTHLVHFNQAKTAREKQEHYAVLRSMAGTVNEAVLRSDQYDYYDKWYLSVLRELVCLHDFRDDWALVGRMVSPPITPSEARKGVEILAKLGLIARREDGAWRQTKSAISADGAVTSVAVRNFVETMFEQAKQSIHAMDRKERHVSSLTIGISAAGYDALVAEIRAFKDRVKALAIREEDPTRVYHLNLGLIPGSQDVSPLRGEGMAEKAATDGGAGEAAA